MGFDVFYMQEDDKEGYTFTFKDKLQQDLIYTKEKRIYRIGIRSSNNINHWSGPFNAENIEDFDLMIKIEKKRNK